MVKGVLPDRATSPLTVGFMLLKRLSTVLAWGDHGVEDVLPVVAVPGVALDRMLLEHLATMHAGSGHASSAFLSGWSP